MVCYALSLPSSYANASPSRMAPAPIPLIPLLRLLLIHLPNNLLLLIRNTLVDLSPLTGLIPMHPRWSRRIDLPGLRLCGFGFPGGVVGIVLVVGRGEAVSD